MSSRGGALPAVLAISALVATLIVSVIAMQHVRTRFILEEANDAKARYAAEEAHARTLRRIAHGQVTVPGPRSSFLSDMCTAPSRCNVRITPFGGYDWVQVEAMRGNATTQLHGLIGHRPKNQLDHALLLTNAPSGISLSRGARLDGTVIMKGTRVEQTARGKPAQQSGFTGAVQSHPTVPLPHISSTFRSRAIHIWSQMLNGPPASSISWIDYAAGAQQSSTPARRTGQPSHGDTERQRTVSHQRGSSLPTVSVQQSLTLRTRDAIRLDRAATFIVAGDLRIEGPIDIPFGSRFIVQGRTDVRGRVSMPLAMIYSAGRIDIDGPARGSVHLSSRTSVSVRSAQFSYPSSVVAIPSSRPSRASATKNSIPLVVSKDASIEGSLFLLSTETNSPSSTRTPPHFRIQIQEGARVRGWVYGQGRVEIRGEVQGTVDANELYTYESPSHLTNWIFNGTLDRPSRPDPFIGPAALAAPSPMAASNAKTMSVGWIPMSDPSPVPTSDSF